MWITEAAREAGVNAQTRRYYERRGPARIAHLQSMRDAPEQLVSSCRQGGKAECPIIDALSTATEAK